MGYTSYLKNKDILTHSTYNIFDSQTCWQSLADEIWNILYKVLNKISGSVQLLLAHGAPVKVKNLAGWSPLAEAISYGDRQTSQ